MQNLYRTSFFALSFFFALQAKSETPCEKMVRITNEMTRKAKDLAKEKPALSDADVSYLLDLCDEATKKLNSILGVQTDGSLVREYHFCRLNMNETVAVDILSAGKSDQMIYDLLSPLSQMVFALDVDIMNNYNYVTCVADNDAAAVVSTSDYELYSVTYYYAYLHACFNLDKLAEAQTAFYHFRRYNFGVQENGAYSVAAEVVNYKINKHKPDALLLDAATYMFDHYIHDYAYDSTQITVGGILIALNDPLLADTSVAGRASDLYNLYGELKVFCKYHSHDDITDKMVEDLFTQSMHATSSTTNIGGLIETMKYNNHPDVDFIIAMDDPVVLQNIIAMSERYITRVGKLKEPYFWQSMVKLYTKAGNTDAAAEAQKKFGKYKNK